MRKITNIILHCTATPEGKDFSVDDIRGWHVKGNGWKDIGYHYVIYRDGTIHVGRPLDQVGAHCSGHNADSIGIVYVGGMDTTCKKAKDTRTPQQKEALYTLCKVLKDTLGIKEIHGHNEYSSKACPSFDVKAWRKQVGL